MLTLVLMSGLLFIFPEAYGLIFGGMALLVVFCLPAFLLVWLLRRTFAWRLARVIGNVVLGAALYSAIYCAIFTAPPGTRMLDAVIQPFWIPAIGGAVICFIISIVIELIFKNPAGYAPTP
ncbi:hypothetical protein [Pseudoxanthomonas sangjuensis]|uniref:hypothetical protein n=1 Tax=Pseudoxanthomonas sangjuensis TaxID=1503750 RepID=UPI001391FB2E|nr:hypothetical protein [Pseudoxanthomonas sangjuensis]